MARAIDKALLRGDGSLSGFTASPTNSIVAGTGYASVITGLCPLAYNGGSALRIGTGGTSTKATPTTIASARAALGRYGLDVGSNNLVYLTSIEGYNDLVTTSDFRTMDKFGDKATYITGQVGSIYGIPVVISEFLDVVGVSGNHVGLLVYLPGFIVGRRRALEVESYYDPRRQLTAIYLSTRFDLKALTTNASAALDTTKYNMAAVVTSN
jgi:HK97 family phage major capsid protein